MSKNKKLKSDEELIQELLGAKLRSYRPDVVRKEQIYQRLIVGEMSKGAWWSWLLGAGRRAVAGAAFAVLFVSVGFTTTYAYYSPQVNSESNLYPLKLAVEDLEYSVTFDQEAKVEKLLKFNDKRKLEIAALEQEGIEDFVAKAEIVNNLKVAKVLVADLENEELDLKIAAEEEAFLETATVIADEEEPVEDAVEDVPVGDVKNPLDILVEIPAAIVKPPVLNVGEEAEIQVEPYFVDDEGIGGGSEIYIIPDEGMGGGGFGDSAPSLLKEVEDVVEPVEVEPVKLKPLDVDIVEPVPEVKNICKDECLKGATQSCADGVKVQQCGNFDDDECLEWGICYYPSVKKLEYFKTVPEVKEEPSYDIYYKYPSF